MVVHNGFIRISFVCFFFILTKRKGNNFDDLTVFLCFAFYQTDGEQSTQTINQRSIF